MARAIDANELEMFPYSEGAGTEEQIAEWVEQVGLSEDDTASRARDLCWKVIEGFINVVKTQPTLTPPNEPLPVLVNDEPDREYIDYICPRCKNTISQRRRGQRMETVYKCKFHDNCGQRVDWSNPQPYRRPPEGEEDT